jgi:Flp pilus assembly protein TadG
MKKELKTIWQCEDGSVTAETAVTLPAIIVFVLFAISICYIGIAKAQSIEAAADAARIIAIGKSDIIAIDVVNKTISNSSVSIENSGDIVTVKVSKKLTIMNFGVKIVDAQVSCYKEPM